MRFWAPSSVSEGSLSRLVSLFLGGLADFLQRGGALGASISSVSGTVASCQSLSLMVGAASSELLAPEGALVLSVLMVRW